MNQHTLARLHLSSTVYAIGRSGRYSTQLVHWLLVLATTSLGSGVWLGNQKRGASEDVGAGLDLPFNYLGIKIAKSLKKIFIGSKNVSWQFQLQIVTNAPETAAVNQHTIAGIRLTSKQKGEVSDTVHSLHWLLVVATVSLGPGVGIGGVRLHWFSK